MSLYCEHHDECMKDIREKIESNTQDLVERARRELDSKHERLNKVEDRIEVVEKELSEHAKEFSETKTYVKELYHRMGEVITAMNSLTIKLDSYIITTNERISQVESDTKRNTENTNDNLALRKDIIKWIVIGVLGSVVTFASRIGG